MTCQFCVVRNYDNDDNVRCRYVVLGNHDHYGDAEAQIKYSEMQLAPGAGGRKWILPHYFWATEKVVGTAKVQLVFIDTVLLDLDITRQTLEGKIAKGVVDGSALADFDAHQPARQKMGEDQLNWLEGTLSASSADFLIVVGHYPVYSGGEHGSTPSLHAKVGCDTTRYPLTPASVCPTAQLSPLTLVPLPRIRPRPHA